VPNRSLLWSHHQYEIMKYLDLGQARRTTSTAVDIAAPGFFGKE